MGGHVEDTLLAVLTIALLVPAANSEALAEALLHGLRKAWDSERIRNHGENYSWGNVADQLVSLYEDLLAGQAPVLPYRNRRESTMVSMHRR